jgi:hypothetical protein
MGFFTGQVPRPGPGPMRARWANGLTSLPSGG